MLSTLKTERKKKMFGFRKGKVCDNPFVFPKEEFPPHLYTLRKGEKILRMKKVRRSTEYNSKGEFIATEDIKKGEIVALIVNP